MSLITKRVTSQNLGKFFDFFKRTVAVEFPEYSKKEIDYIVKQSWGREKYSNWLKQKNRFIIATWDKNKIVAILDAEQPFLGVCFCCWLMVDKKYQRQGIGTSLLHKLEKTAARKGAHMIYLFASKHNITYYRKIGYRLEGNMRKSWFGQDNYIFTKLIREPKEKNYLKKVAL